MEEKEVNDNNWNCPYCNGPLNENLINRLSVGYDVNCEYCRNVIKSKKSVIKSKEPIKETKNQSMYIVGGLGSLLFALNGIIYTFLRSGNYYNWGGSLKLFVNASLDASLRVCYVFMGIGLILIGIQLILIYNEHQIGIAPFTTIMSLLAGLFIFLGYPSDLYPKGNRFSFPPTVSPNFVLFLIGNVFTAIFFVFYSQVLRINSKNVNNEKFTQIISPFFLIFGFAYIGFTIGVSTASFALWSDSFMLGGMLQMGFMFSSFPYNPPDPIYIGIMILLDQWHYVNGNPIFAYFLLWWIPLLGLSFLNLFNGFNFFLEEEAAGKQTEKIEEITGDIEKDLIELIQNVSSEYGGITLQRLAKKAGYKTSIIRSVLENLENRGMFLGDIHGNLLIFNKSQIPIPIQKRTVYTPPVKKKGIIVKRGGEIQGGQYIYKIKVENNTDYNITDINFQIIAYPEDSIELNGDPFREIQKLDANGIVSPTFEFRPTKDCIVGTIHSTVTYIDYLNKPHTINVEPYTISMTCGLLSAKQIDIGRFTQITEELLDFRKAGQEIQIPYNVKLIFEKLKVVLPDHNFFLVTRPEEKTLGNMFIGEFNGFAQGKYNKKEIGLTITLSGEENGYHCVGMIEAFSQDRSMLPPLISELSKKMIIWNCQNCNAPLEKEDVEKLLQNQVIKCQYCGYSISHLLE